MRLPTFSELESGYLKYGRDYPGGGVTSQQFGNIVGGKVQANIQSGVFTNTCALRVSHALNSCNARPPFIGHKIPRISGQTSSAANGDWYIFRVKALHTYMLNTYGPPSLSSSNPSDFAGRKGIIMYDMGNFWSDATGHFTLYNDSRRLGGNYKHSYYLKNGVQAHLWETN